MLEKDKSFDSIYSRSYKSRTIRVLTFNNDIQVGRRWCEQKYHGRLTTFNLVAVVPESATLSVVSSPTQLPQRCLVWVIKFCSMREIHCVLGRALCWLNFHNIETNEEIMRRLEEFLVLDVEHEQKEAATTRGLRYHRKPYKYQCSKGDCSFNFTRLNSLIQHRMEEHLLFRFRCVLPSALTEGMCQNPPSLSYKLYSDHVQERHTSSM